ncbi:MAG: hypothetical protein WBK43_05865 [Prolixibacteraceae bacterium]|jgi:hypothetical protein|nr:hypothetical protein [Bacteroidota bacterium]NLS99081.1 hypothetical protein [Bacteroidales bacterium]OQB79566.1 MAG: hypothetical protein BWX87_02008 [Bacteroidetes bacterium ADurb.Bin123]HNZ69238.1 hypothetical protein [Prolixibacteraceae bacterium]HOC85542.1 hypothetical protein [Prolixibacteraceae bacterium]
MNSIVIIGIIITALIVGPIWWLIHTQGAGKRKLEKELAALGQKEGIEISEHQSWSNKVIGLDREHEKAAFLIQGNPQNKIILADLKKYTGCSVEKKLLENGSKENAILFSSIALCFTPREKSAPALVFPLYTDEEDMTLNNELHIAEEWSGKFNVIIRRNI